MHGGRGGDAHGGPEQSGHARARGGRADSVSASPPLCMTCGPELQHANLSQIGLPSQENNVPKPLECVKWPL